jgi:protein SCO1/2
MKHPAFMLAFLFATLCRAAPLPGWDPHPGARLPLDTALVDEAGRATPLGRSFGQGPVVLVLGYFNCPNLCGATMQDLLAAASDVRLPPESYRIIAVSVDPAEDARVAANKRDSYLRELAGTGIRLGLLTGSADATARLASAAGFRFVHDPQRGLMHPSGFLVAGPDGTISRYFFDTHVESRDLRLALVQASQGEVGTLSDRIALVCSHFDPATGRYTGAALVFVRAGTILALALLAAVAIRARRRAGRQA